MKTIEITAIVVLILLLTAFYFWLKRKKKVAFYVIQAKRGNIWLHKNLYNTTRHPKNARVFYSYSEAKEALRICTEAHRLNMTIVFMDKQTIMI